VNELKNAGTVPPGLVTPKGEYPLVNIPLPEANVFWLSVIILAWDIGLVLTAAIVEPDYAAVGRRSLRPVDPSIFECELFGRVIASRQVGNERGDLAGHRIDYDNA